ncbi:MAG: YD repeat-containing protein [Flavobacterium sp.]|nr:YD repeat-containing protein [Flavobacterium sp.]
MKQISLYLLFIVPVLNGYSQVNDPSKLLGQIKIASPNAASLGKYIDVPVSYHTGVPNITVPICLIKSGPIQLPINMSYHASGLKVEENDSWVGAGWTLNAGGCITRTVKSKPDERQTASLQQNYGHYSDWGYASIFDKDWSSSIPTGDYEPDLFTFNFNGFSGNFWFNDDRTVMMAQEQDLKIECSYTSGIWNNSPGAWAGLGRCIESFIITTEDGTKYYFGISANGNASSNYCDPIEVVSPFNNDIGSSYSQVISSWFLNKIVSPDGNFSLNFYYIREKYSFYNYSSFSSNLTNFSSNLTSFSSDPINGASNNLSISKLTKNLIAGVQLSRISAANEIIDFIPGPVRQDLSRWASGIDINMTDNINQSSTALGSINISDATGNGIKKFNFAYDYFVDNTTSQSPNLIGTMLQYDKKRLKLLSIQEQSFDGATTNPPYTFGYFNEPVPRKLSFSKDHWGYNNGITTNVILIPQVSDNNGLINLGSGIPFANRETSWPAMRAGTLNTIIYPTGGSTRFDFEPNYFTLIKNGTLIDQMLGGLRIKTITQIDPSTNATIVTNYSYQTQATGFSSGVLYSRPNYIQIIRNNTFVKTNGIGSFFKSGCLEANNDSTAIVPRTYAISDNSIRPMETTQGYHIGYGEVKVSQSGNGYTIHRFSVIPPWQIDRTSLTTNYINSPGPCSYTIPNYPPAPLPTDYYRGRATYEGAFKESGTIVYEKEFYSSYLENPVTTPGILSFPIIGTSGNIANAVTNYELKTARKISDSTVERKYDPLGLNPLQTYISNLYESKYHHQPTTIRSTNSTGDIIEKHLQYTCDYTPSQIQNLGSCYSDAASFIKHENNLYYSGGYSTSFYNCNSSADPVQCFYNKFINWQTSIWNDRRNYINCRRLNFTDTSNLYQQYHDIAKSKADILLKPILWMQDSHIITAIEKYTYKNGILLNALFNQYENLRDDAFGNYLNAQLQTDLQALSPSFAPSVITSDGTSIKIDTKYSLANTVDFTMGNVINILPRSGMSIAYEWGYNKHFPITQIFNATNKYKEKIHQGVVNQNINFMVGGSSQASTSQTFNFTQSYQGDITAGITSTPPPSAVVNATITLTPKGTGNSIVKYITLPYSSSNVIFSNIPIGVYSLQYVISSPFASYAFVSTFSYNYQGMVTSLQGPKYFYTQNFEDNLFLGNVTSFAHTGTKCYSGSFTIPFTPPPLDARTYIVQWWSYNSGWNFNQSNYTPNQTLNGIIDDIRVFPSNALVTTYTYHPTFGITSETDPNGKTSYYDYDGFGRLLRIRDQDNNIIKSFDYKYQQTP